MSKSKSLQHKSGSQPSYYSKEDMIQSEGEYGVMKNGSFVAVTNFVLECTGIIEEKGDVLGFTIRAKPKSHREESAEESEKAW